MKGLPRFPKRFIIAGALVVIVLVWTFVVAQMRYERDEAVEGAIRENVNRAIALEQYVARTLEGADLATAYIADHYASLLEGNDNTATVLKIVPLKDFAVRSPSLQEINVINARGELVATSVPFVSARVNVFDAPLFQRHRSDPSTALLVNPPSRSRFLNAWFVLLSRRVNRRDGSFGGTVSVQLRPSELTNILRNAALGKTDMLSVIGLDGVTRARRSGAALSFGQDLRGTLVMQRQAEQPNGTYLGPSALDGMVRYFSHRRLSRYGIFVTSGVAQAAILRPIELRARAYIAGAALISVAVMLAAWLSLSLIKRRNVREAEIVAANQRLREAQQLARLGDWSFDVEAARFWWSPELCEMYGRAPYENHVEMADFEELFGRHGRDVFDRTLKHLEQSGSRLEYELAARLPGEAISHRWIVAVPDLDVAGALIGVHGTDQDITPGKLLDSLQEQVGHLSRMDAYNAIAATLAHELNQPLAAASSYLSGSMRLVAPGKDFDRNGLRETLVSVRDQILYAGDIIRRVRDLATNRRAKSEVVSLGETIVAALSLSEAAQPGICDTVSVQPSADKIMVLGDPIQLRQVIINLIRNARQASRPREPHIFISAERGDSRMVTVRLRDDGPGIVGDGRDVFSPFTTSKPDGLGIGLAISRTLIEAMGGAIWVEDTSSSGTTVSFSLPGAHCAEPAD